ncbi:MULTISPECIES: LacI family DNA-binding transcriptional regulator [unclassified Actinomyces]|uniref:LacI family DNA-binding transcriptional regulator n=2 Tax=Actinomyces TaxID=1654 RepID=UPI0020179287|nr:MULTISPECIES: LacI family DNA-binding transcriptional regulator [unclassified Actinomyces]MCL3777421.1 LacI family DNA-binding transcriptional regulator [Actinomyces sp. AC-20-1]MCL3790515.1 LacI family DNA-binding transcriptional regulator [Actinomyces sp. 187325]MCL3792097.1 LacI family DNA-binding transcriptional regulator [Actinomyces sp. 186855]MCL3795204.1 LacI family DNA-binding transcriptional regulator [Actinomyces sp. 217892]
MTTTRAAGAPRRATIKDVAAEAGVSVAAVSKVIRNAYGVSEQMRERVNAAIDTLGYRPRTGARTMRGSSHTIGVLLTDFQSPFQFEVASAIAERLAGTGYQDLLSVAGVTAEAYGRRVDAMLDLQVDGLVLISPRMRTEQLHWLARQLPVTTIALHGEPEDFDTVVTDEALGAELMVDHLTRLGHERITYNEIPRDPIEIDHPLSQTVRRDGFAAAMERRGLVPDVIAAESSEAGGHELAERSLSRRHRPTAVFASTDHTAFGVLEHLEAAGLAVPGDVSVAGYDNVHTSSLSRVSLTTVDQSGEQTGSAAISLLLERIGGRADARHHVVEPTLVVRSTTGPAADA